MGKKDSTGGGFLSSIPLQYPIYSKLLKISLLVIEYKGLNLNCMCLANPGSVDKCGSHSKDV